MARFRIKKMAQERGMKNAMDLVRETGIGYSLAREIWKGTEDLNIETRTLSLIAAKFRVKIQDLFADEPEGNS